MEEWQGITRASARNPTPATALASRSGPSNQSLLMVAGAAAGILGAIAPGVGWLLLLICAACVQGIVSFYIWMTYGPTGSFAAKPTPPFTEG